MCGYMSVALTYLFVCPLAHLKKPHVRISPNFLYLLTVAVARSSSNGKAISCVFPVLWMTSCFHVEERMDRIRDDACVSSSSPGGGTGRTSANVVWLSLLGRRHRGRSLPSLAASCSRFADSKCRTRVRCHGWVHKAAY